MRNPFFPAMCVAAALWTAPVATAQVHIDTSSPESVMASLAELHERWTLSEFTEFMRAAMMAGLPDHVEDPASWQENRSRWEFLPDTLAIFASAPISLPLVLEGEPLLDYFPSEKIGPLVWKFLRHGLEDRTIQALVRFGGTRERAALVGLRKQAASALPELEEQVARAEADASRPGASTRDRYAFERQARRLARHRVRIERLDRRLDRLQGTGDFAPGAIGCSLDRRVDLSTEEAMLADVEALAKTCRQQVLIRFLRAAAFVSEVPASLAEPGARMDPAALRRTKDRLRSAMLVIVGLAAVLQKDPLISGVASVPGRLRKMLELALDGRTMSEVTDEGERLERAFLTALRDELSDRLRAERQREVLAQENASPQRASTEISRLRADIERIDRRLALLEAETPAPPTPDAN